MTNPLDQLFNEILETQALLDAATERFTSGILGTMTEFDVNLDAAVATVLDVLDEEIEEAYATGTPAEENIAMLREGFTRGVEKATLVVTRAEQLAAHNASGGTQMVARDDPRRVAAKQRAEEIVRRFRGQGF